MSYTPHQDRLRIHRRTPHVLDRADNQAELRERLWSHREHTNTDFNSLASFFLVAESILLAVIANLVDKPSVTVLVYGITALGTLLSLVWWLVQNKQRRLLNQLKSRCERELPEYLSTHQIRSSIRPRYSNTWVLANVVPMMFLSTWMIVIVGVFFK